MSALAGLFFLRVAGQALQRWWPMDWLPPFGAFQGSGLSYPVLLGSQLIILAVMLIATSRALRAAGHPGAIVPQRRTVLALGGAYMFLSVLRMAVGLLVPSAPAWFRAFIPGFFHLILAGFVLVAGSGAGASGSASRTGP